MKSFSWVHLTDLHQGMKQQGWLWPGVRESFFEDLKRLHDKCGPWDLVLFTGDLTQGGQEFQKVDELLAQLWKHFDELGSKPKLLAVPGNHDLVRPNEKQPAVRLLGQWDDYQDIQEEFWDEVESSYRQIVTKAFENYVAWWEKQPYKAKGVTFGILPGDFSVSIEKGGVRLGIVGLNTAFLQLTGDDYKGKLALHARQFHEACESDGPNWAKQHHACLLLTHHPPAWLNPDSQQHLEGEIISRGRFAVHLCGHMHETAYRSAVKGGTEPRRTWQGRSLFGLESFEEAGNKAQRLHGYAVGKIELYENKGTFTFWPREARRVGRQLEIVPDYSLRLNDNQHTDPVEFDLLRPLPRTRPTEPEPTPFIPFANREAEWEKVVLDPEGQYFWFEGPAGYGKTALLKKLDKEFAIRKWLCAYVSLQEHNTPPKVANYVVEELQVQIDVDPEDPYGTGVALGEAIAGRQEAGKFEGLALLLDVDHEPLEYLIQTLRTILRYSIPGLYDGLTHKSDYFRSKERKFIVVIAGRYLTSRLEEEYRDGRIITQLTPFDYRVVREVCKGYIQDAREIDEFAANLLFYSGGHPRCMVRTLQKFEEAGKPPADFFRFHREEIEVIAYHEAIWVRASIMRDWREIFDVLCVYRRLDLFLLRLLLEKGLVRHEMVEDEHDLRVKLKLSYLMDWADEPLHLHLSDSITRRLLQTRLRYDISPLHFQQRCKEAEEHCLECLEQSDEAYSPYWAVEALFGYLQGNVAKINDKAARQNMRQQFFSVKLPAVLRKLGGKRDPELRKESLCGILDRDWEFQFTLNHYLRADHYDETPYQEMLRHIEQFC